MIGRRPETLQIRGDLHGSIVRAQKMQQDRHAPSRQPGRLGPPEQLLQPDGKDRRSVQLIEQAMLPAARNLERQRRRSAQARASGQGCKGFEVGNLVGLANFFDAGPALTELSSRATKALSPISGQSSSGRACFTNACRQPGRRGRIVPEQ